MKRVIVLLLALVGLAHIAIAQRNVYADKVIVRESFRLADVTVDFIDSTNLWEGANNHTLVPKKAIKDYIQARWDELALLNPTVYVIASLADTSTISSPNTGDIAWVSTAEMAIKSTGPWLAFVGGGAGSGTTEEADGVTILGTGTPIDKFRVDSLLFATLAQMRSEIADSLSAFSPGASTLNDLTDVDLTGAASGNFLRRNSFGIWVDSTFTEGQTLVFSSPNLSISGGNSVDLSGLLAGYVTGSGSANRIAFWNGTNQLTNSSNLTFNGSSRIGLDNSGGAELYFTNLTYGSNNFHGIRWFSQGNWDIGIHPSTTTGDFLFSDITSGTPVERFRVSRLTGTVTVQGQLLSQNLNLGLTTSSPTSSIILTKYPGSSKGDVLNFKSYVGSGATQVERFVITSSSVATGNPGIADVKVVNANLGVQVSSAAYSIANGGTDAIGIPRGTISQRPPINALSGQPMRWNTETGFPEIPNASSEWLRFVLLPDATPSTGHYIQWDGSKFITAAVSAGATNLDGLSDVTITGASLNNFLTHNGSVFVNRSITQVADSIEKYIDPVMIPQIGEVVQDNAAAMITAGTHSGVSVSYNDASNTFSITNTSAAGNGLSKSSQTFSLGGSVSSNVLFTGSGAMTWQNTGGFNVLPASGDIQFFSADGNISFTSPGGGKKISFLANDNNFEIGTNLVQGLPSIALINQAESWRIRGGNTSTDSHFRIEDIDAGSTYLQIENDNGALTLAPGYGTGSITGTAAYNLQVTSTGKTIATPQVQQTQVGGQVVIQATNASGEITTTHNIGWTPSSVLITPYYDSSAGPYIVQIVSATTTALTVKVLDMTGAVIPSTTIAGFYWQYQRN